MNAPKYKDAKNLICLLCEYQTVLQDAFYQHLMSHVSLPSVVVTKLSCKKLLHVQESQEFKPQSSGVARKSTTVSPIKMSFKKKGNTIIACITQKESDDRASDVTMSGNMLERGVSIQRKGKNVENVLPENNDVAIKKPAESQETLMQKYGGLISITKKSANKDDAASEDVKPTGLSIGSKSAKPFDLAEYTKLLKENSEVKPPAKDAKSLLANMSGISFATKSGAVKSEETAEAVKSTQSQEENKSDEEEGEESDESEESNDGKDVKKDETMKNVRIANNLFPVKKEETMDSIEVKEPVLPGVEIMQAMVKKLRNTPTPPRVTNSPETKPKIISNVQVSSTIIEVDDDIIMEREVTKTPAPVTTPVAVLTPSATPMPVPSPTPSEQLHPDFIAPSNGPPPAMNGQIFQPAPPLQAFSNVQQATMVQPIVSGNYTSVENVSSMAANTTVMGTTAGYWTEMGAAPTMAPTQQDPLIATDGHVSQAFLQSYLGDQQSLQSDGGEYMALERLGGMAGDPNQQQYQQMSDSGVQPMDQLNQQVQRLESSQPHINVIPQHQLQMPPLHPGTKDAQLEVSQNIGPVEPVYDLMHGGMPIPQPPLQMAPNAAVRPPALYQFPFQNFNTTPQQQQQLQQAGAPSPTNQQAGGNFQVPQPPGNLRPPMLQSRPQICARSFHSMAPPRPRMGMKRPRMNSPRQNTPPKVPRMSGPTMRPPSLSAMKLQQTPPKKTAEGNKVANALASRGITMTSNRQQVSPGDNRSPIRSSLPNLGPGVSISSTSGRRPVVNHNLQRPEPCATVDLTDDDDQPQRGGSYSCNLCRKLFSSAIALDTHKQNVHKNAPLSKRCEKCSAAYHTLEQLNEHRAKYHQLAARVEELAIPIVDVNNAETRAKLLRQGIAHYIPLSALQSGNNGSFGLPILNINRNHDKVTSTSALGAGNVFMLGKPKSV